MALPNFIRQTCALNVLISNLTFTTWLPGIMKYFCPVQKNTSRSELPDPSGPLSETLPSSTLCSQTNALPATGFPDSFVLVVTTNHRLFHETLCSPAVNCTNSVNDILRIMWTYILNSFYKVCIRQTFYCQNYSSGNLSNINAAKL